jgi:hypothetical protein
MAKKAFYRLERVSAFSWLVATFALVWGGFATDASAQSDASNNQFIRASITVGQTEKQRSAWRGDIERWRRVAGSENNDQLHSRLIEGTLSACTIAAFINRRVTATEGWSESSSNLQLRSLPVVGDALFSEEVKSVIPSYESFLETWIHARGARLEQGTAELRFRAPLKPVKKAG